MVLDYSTPLLDGHRNSLAAGRAYGHAQEQSSIDDFGRSVLRGWRLWLHMYDGRKRSPTVAQSYSHQNFGFGNFLFHHALYHLQLLLKRTSRAAEVLL